MRLLHTAGPADLRGCPLHPRELRRQSRVVLGGDGPQPGALQVERGELTHLLDRFGLRATDGGQRIAYARHGHRITRVRVPGITAQHQMVDGLRSDIAGGAAAEPVVQLQPRARLRAGAVAPVPEPQRDPAVVLQLTDEVPLAHTRVEQIPLRGPPPLAVRDRHGGKRGPRILYERGRGTPQHRFVRIDPRRVLGAPGVGDLPGDRIVQHRSGPRPGRQHLQTTQLRGQQPFAAVQQLP